ncbi:DUF6474 family protein [Haloechinothrix salitolerans]|uniref:DUF6474 family protein n=1 Tax=Haloechinothrix salitolerans TaxID=926830 RepID=A0ABW2BRG7_9PSEU
MARKKKEAPEAEHGFAAETLESLEKATKSKKLTKAAKREAKAAKKDRKAAKKAAKKSASATPTTQEAAHEEHALTAKKARQALTVTKVILPAVIPVVTPIAVRAAGACRDAYDKYQARKLGVAVDSLGEYSGHGAALHARIAGLSDGLNELRVGGTAEGVQFADEAAGTVRQLSSAVRAAEHMPPGRRKDAHRAIAAELEELEATLLHHLGV